MAAATFRYLVQLHRDVPKAARFYSEGLGFTIDVCTLRWAELHSGPLKLSILHSPRCVPSFSKFNFFCYLIPTIVRLIMLTPMNLGSILRVVVLLMIE